MNEVKEKIIPQTPFNFDETIFRKACHELIEQFIQEENSQSQLPIFENQTLNAQTKVSLSEEGVGLNNTIHIFKHELAPHLIRNSNSRFFNWVVGGRTPASVLGDFYTTIYDQIVMLAGHGIASDIESQTIHFLLNLFSLSADDFQGVFTTGATEANLCALASARQWYGEKFNINVSHDGFSNLPVMTILTSLPHSSIDKSMQILGCGSKQVIKIANESGKFDLEKLEEHLKNKPHQIVVANCGEVNTGDSDDLTKIATLCQQYQAWFHVDAAFGLFARCSPKHFALTNGIEHADSITCDAHKLGNVPYGCGFLFIRKNKYHYLQQNFATVAPYLSANYDHPMNTRVANSQRFLALPMWFSLLAYGKKGYRDMVERQTKFAKKMAEWIMTHNELELLHPVTFNIVIFRHKKISTVEENQKLIRAINQTNLLSLSGTVFNKMPALRIAVANWHTNIDDDFELTIKGLKIGIENFIK